MESFKKFLSEAGFARDTTGVGIGAQNYLSGQRTPQIQKAGQKIMGAQRQDLSAPAQQQQQQPSQFNWDAIKKQMMQQQGQQQYANPQANPGV